MQSTTLPVEQAQNQFANSAGASNSVSSQEHNQPATLLACFLLPADQAERLVSMLRDLAAHPAREPLSSIPSPIAQAPQSNCSWLNHAEAAAYLGIGISTLYRYAEQERIECRKIGNRLEYRRSSLDRFKESLIRPARRARMRGIIAPTLGSGN